MRLRQLMSQAMSARGAGGQGKEAGEVEGKVVDPRVRLTEVLQGVYREGGLGSNPYHVELGKMRAREVEERREREELRLRRSPQPVSAVLPVMRVDEGEEEEDREEEEAGEEQRRAKRSAINRLTQSVGIGAFHSAQPWYLYPPLCTVAGGQSDDAVPPLRSSATDGGRLERVR